MRTVRRRRWWWGLPEFSRPRLELLEDRTLLDGGLVNATITQAQANGILGGLRGLVTFANNLDSYDLLAKALPGIRKIQTAPDSETIGQAVDIAGALQRGLDDPLSAFFQEHDGNAHHLPSADELVKVIKEELSGNYNGLVVTVDPRLVTGGFNRPANQLQFTLSFQAARTLTVPIDLGSNAFTQYGLTLNASANVNLALSLNFSFTFGFKLDQGLTADQAFFIQVNTFTACASAHAANLNFGATFGFFDLGVQNASVNFDACTNIAFPGRPTITLRDLGTPLANLVSLAPMGNTGLNISLPVFGSLGGFTVPNAATINLSTPNLFTTLPTVTLPNFGDLLNFNNITAGNVLGLFTQFRSWLNKLGDSSPLSLSLPFTQNWTLGNLFDFGKSFDDNLGSGLESAPGKPAFSSAQSLANLLARLLGLGLGAIQANFDPTTESLSYHVQWTETLPTQSVPVGFNVGLGQDLAEASASGMVNLNAQVTLQATVGIDLTPKSMGQTLADKLFVQNASASGTLMMNASNISAMARFGFLQIQSSGGTASATGNLTVQLKDPGSGTPGGRVTLKELFDGLASNPSTVVGVTVNGNASLSLQHITPPDNILGTINGNPTITVAVPDITNLPSTNITFTDFDKFLHFRTVNFASVVNALTGVANYLQTVSGFSFLNTKLPLLDKSITDLLGYAGQFANFVSQFQANPTATVEGLAPELRMLLGLPANDPRVNITYTADNVLALTLTVAAPHYMATLPLDFDFKQLVPNSTFDNLVSASGSLAVTADASLTLHVGVDLSNPTTPVPFLYDDTQMTLSASATGTNLNLSAAIGPLGLFVTNGSATLGPANFTVGLRPGTNGRWNFTDLMTSSASISLTGTASATLPLYFPTVNDPLGGAGNNNLTLTIGNLGNIAGTTTVMKPDLSSAFSQVNLLTQLDIVIEGMDKLLETLQNGLNSQVFANLPLIGNNLQNTGHFIQDFRTTVINNLRGMPDQAVNTVRTTLFNTFGPSGLGILKKLSGTGTPTIDDVQLTFPTNAVQINMHLGQSYTVGAATAFDIGLPGLGLTVNNGGVQVQLNWDFYFGFGVSRSSGFYFDTSRRNPLSVTLTATVPGLNAMGQLLFLSVGLQDNTANPSNFTGQFAVDIHDPRNSGQLTFGDITAPGFSVSQIISATLSGTANVHLKLRVDFGSANFPSLQTDFDMQWGFSASPTGVSLATFGMKPTIAFDNVSLDLGSFFSKFARPVLNQIQSAINPILPVVNLLDANLPVLSNLGANVSFLSLLGTFSPGLASFLTAVRDVANLITSIPSVGTILISFGSFNLGTFDIRGGSLRNVIPNITLGMPGGTLDQQLQNIGTTQANQSRMFVSRMSREPGGGIQFPFIQNPSTLFGVLLGQSVTLFTYDMPTFSAGFSYSQFFPIPAIPVLGVRISGSVTISAHLKFGFDTYGFTRYAQTHTLTDVFEGFYIDPTASYIRVQGRLAAAAELNLVIATAGAEGGITATVNLGLRDPEGMGKVRPHVLIAEAMQNPLCIFNVSGEVTAGLTVYASVGVWCPDFLCQRFTYNLATVTLVSFNATFCSPVATSFQISTAASTTAGAPTQITVRAVDGSGNVVPNYRGTVHFTSTDAQGVLPHDYTFVTGDQGVHVFTMNLRTAGNQTVTVTDTGNSGLSQNATLTVTPAAASTFSFAVPMAPFIAGVAGNVTVTAQDPYGNTAPTYRGMIHFTSTDPQVVLPPDYQYVAADNGVHTFLVTFKTAPTQALSATDTAQATITGTRTGIQVNPAAADHLIIRKPFPSPTIAGDKRMFEVVAKDPFNNDATGYTGTVHFTGNPARKDVLPSDYTFAADDHGAHFFEIEFRIAGTYSLTATDVNAANLTVTQNNIQIVAALPMFFTVTGYPSPSTAGDIGSITVTASPDRFGNPTTNYRGTIHFTSTDPMATLPGNYTFTADDVNGMQTQHTFLGVSLCLAGTQAITVQDVNPKRHITGTQGGLVVQAGPPTELGLMFTRSPVTAGDMVTIIVQAQDQCHNYTTNYLGTVTFTSSDPLIMPGDGLPNDYTFTAADMGRHSFIVEMRTAGNQTVTATDTGSGINGTGRVIVNPGPADHFDVIVTPPITATVPFTVTVTARDKFNNQATGYINVIHFTSSDGAAGVVLPPNYGFSQTDNGTHTFTMAVTLRTKGNQTLTVTDTANANLKGTANITVNPAPTRVVVSTSSSTVYGQTATFRATVSAIAPASGIPTGMVQFQVDGQNVGNPVNLDAGGVATFMINTITAGMHTITAIYQGDMTYGTSTSAGLTQNVLQAPLTITADNKTKVYGANLPVFTVTYSGFVLGENSSVLQGVLTFMTTATAASPVGNYAITPDGQTALNYAITYVNGTLMVTPAPLTITADNKTKLYGAAVPMLTATYTGFVNGDDSTSLTTPVVLNTSASMSSSVGTYPITASGATSPNYTITFVNGTLTVNPAPLTITADNKMKVYGAALPSLTASYNGFVLGEGPSVLTGTLTLMTTATAASPVGNYPITPSGQTATNYAITYVNGNLAVTPAPLTVTANNQSKTYGQPFTFAGTEFMTSGLVNNDTVSSVTLISDGAVMTAAVGTYDIIASAAVGTGLGNYLISYAKGTLTVNPAPLTVTANNQSKTYGQPFTFAGTEFMTSGLVNNDTVSSVTLTSDGAPASAAVGTYDIIPSAAMGSGLSNYAISYSKGTLTVTPASLTITANNRTKTYGQTVTFAGTEFTTSGLINSDTVSSVTLTSTGAPASAAVGSYDIIPSAAMGTGLSNYMISYTKGTLTVNPAPLTITANNRTKIYGQAVTFAGTEFTTSGLVNSDMVNSVTLTSDGAPASAPVGTYPIIPSAAMGSGLSNYTINYVNGTLTVNPGMTTTMLQASSDQSYYTQNVTFTATVTPVPPLTGTPTGMVTFNVDGFGQYFAMLNNGVATFITNQLYLGTHTIVAVYSGDSNFPGSTSNSLNHTVNANTTTTSQPRSSRNPSYNTQQVTFSVTVMSTTPVMGPPTGTVNFFFWLNGGGFPGYGTLDSNGVATVTTSLSTGTWTVTASYMGDGTFQGSAAPPLTQMVNPNLTTTSTPTSTANPSQSGQTVTFAVSVAPSGGTPFTGPTGSVTFWFFQQGGGGFPLYTSLDNNGMASVNTSLSSGTWSVYATYMGDGVFQGSTSSTLTQTVTGNPSPNDSRIPNSGRYPSLESRMATLNVLLEEYGADAGVGFSPAFSWRAATFETGLTALKHLVPIPDSGAISFRDDGLPFGSHAITAAARHQKTAAGESLQAKAGRDLGTIPARDEYFTDFVPLWDLDFQDLPGEMTRVRIEV